MVASAGLEPAHAIAVGPVHARRLFWIALMAHVSSATAAMGSAALIRLGLDSLAGAVLALVLAWAMGLNLHRLLLSGSAHALERPTPPATRTPSRAPVLLAVLLGLILGQPLLVILSAEMHSEDLALVRRSMMDLHRHEIETRYAPRLEALEKELDALDRALEAMPTPADSSLGTDRRRRRLAREQRNVVRGQYNRLTQERAQALGPSLLAYQQHLEESTLMVQRWHVLWTRSIEASIGTFVIVLLALLGPLAPWWEAGAMSSYLALRHEQERRLVQRHHAVLHRQARAYLHAHGVRDLQHSPWVDAPFCTEATHRLRPQPCDPRIRHTSPHELVTLLRR